MTELEGRHAASSETVMEAVTCATLADYSRPGAFHASSGGMGGVDGGGASDAVAAGFLATRVSTLLLLRHHLDLWDEKKLPAQRKGAVRKALPLGALADLARPPGEGDKLLLREARPRPRAAPRGAWRGE